MYKKILFMLFGICLFSAMGLAKTNETNLCNELAIDPPDWNHGNWNGDMDPHGCVLLDYLDRLKIRFVIYFAIEDIDSYAGPAVYYTTQFYGGAQSGLIGPITNDDLNEEILPGTNQTVWVYRSGVYQNTFSTECGFDPNNPISFDFNITLKTEQIQDYPIADNLGLVPTEILYPGGINVPQIPGISYAGNHGLCCNSEDIDPSPMVQDPNDGAQAVNNHSFDSSWGEYNPGTNLESYDLAADDIFRPNSNFQEPVISPNPFDETIRINFQASNGESTSIQLWDANGRMVHQYEQIATSDGVQKTEFDTQYLESGFYYCRIKSDTQSYTRKVLKLN